MICVKIVADSGYLILTHCLPTMPPKTTKQRNQEPKKRKQNKTRNTEHGKQPVGERLQLGLMTLTKS